MSKKLMEYFNKQPRLGCLSTANKEGKVNVAYFGSPKMIDEKTIVMGLGKNRTFAYLQENPNAVFMIMEPGKTIPEWKGVRIYVRMSDCQTSGPKLDEMKAKIAAVTGEAGAKMIHAAVSFEIVDIKPLADFGQGWEKSIG
ncbi:MAG TPA: pyridoxamine 5-phosphate oxidase [Deltaproteobacteria bacterium]|nr:pyridoxamine 5-phosphate oxidase [Deltaproteobacteria bacterium]